MSSYSMCYAPLERWRSWHSTISCPLQILLNFVLFLRPYFFLFNNHSLLATILKRHCSLSPIIRHRDVALQQDHNLPRP